MTLNQIKEGIYRSNLNGAKAPFFMKYRSAYKYSLKLTKDEFNYKDILHDAWIGYYTRTGKNLLEEHDGLVMRTIKWEFYNKVRNEKFKNKVSDEHLPSQFDPIKMYETKEFYCCLYDLVSKYKVDAKIPNTNKNIHSISGETLVEILDLVDRGFSFREIEEKMSMSQQKLQYHKEKLRTIIRNMLVQSPFNSNKLKVKKITKAEYEKHPEKYDDYVYDTDRWADCNESYTQLVHKEKEEGLLIVESKKLDL